MKKEKKYKISSYITDHFKEKYGNNYQKASFSWDDIKKTNAISCIAVKKAMHNALRAGNVSDGYHTFNELYRYRMLYNAALLNMMAKFNTYNIIKSKKHSDGEPCFGGGWFVVMATLPTGQISNHYEMKYWDLFNIKEADMAYAFDGHTPEMAADRLEKFIGMCE